MPITPSYFFALVMRNMPITPTSVYKIHKYTLKNELRDSTLL